jgi:hypothetical protein
MDYRETEIKDRLNAIAGILKIDTTELVSVKFNPLMPSENATPFGKFSTAYQYPSEYAAGLEKIKVEIPDDSSLKKIYRTVRHPMPWGEPDKTIYIIKDTNTQTVFWIQHETGLEIIGAVKSIVDIVKTLIDIIKAMRKKAKENKQAESSDRYWKQITKSAITTRKFDSNGNLRETIVEETEITNESFGLTQEEFSKKLQS